MYHSHKSFYDCVVTCFFLDTATNIFDYIETITQLLRPGGFWINFGPLLYHHASDLRKRSIELSYDELRLVIESYGFTFEREEVQEKTNYRFNPDSMISTVYKCVLFTATKTAKGD
eukprot:TRINITY_DN694_c0_g1_i6.p2 TRINITY_DN694_c0_g1~~TRINITY_DN694_c0_g1_i6.p2  ORF type:complete len:116 (+),score=16.35 TRINITY_DN694_c0_g1_i6:955-1302(+)